MKFRPAMVRGSKSKKLGALLKKMREMEREEALGGGEEENGGGMFSASTASAKLQQLQSEGAEIVADQKPFKGIRMRRWGRWVSEIRIPRSRTRIWLGSYDTAEKAARAYDAALYCLNGGRGRFNFPDAERPNFSEELRLALSKSDIKAIAARFASTLSSSSAAPVCAHLQLPPSSPRESSRLSCESYVAQAVASKCGDTSDPLMEEYCGSSFGFDDLLPGDSVVAQTCWDLLLVYDHRLQLHVLLHVLGSLLFAFSSRFC